MHTLEDIPTGLGRPADPKPPLKTTPTVPFYDLKGITVEFDDLTRARIVADARRESTGHMLDLVLAGMRRAGGNML